MLLTIVAFIVVLGVLIFVHEVGHFVAAKAVGVQVLRFSLGFGRPLVQWRRGETEYWISWLPLGGYVKMAGLEDEGITGTLEGGRAAVAIDPARSFERQALWKRTIVIIAGVTMNALFAIATYATVYGTVGAERIATTTIDSVYTSALPPGAGALATLRRGDRIVAVNGDSVTSWDDLLERLLTSPLPLAVSVAGRAAPLGLELPRRSAAARAALSQALAPAYPALVQTVQPASPAARAGFRPGDRVVRVNGDSMFSWGQFARLVRASPHRRLAVEVARGGALVQLTLVPELRSLPDPQTSVVALHGYAGIGPVQPIVRERYTPLAALRAGWTRAGFVAGGVLRYLEGLVTGEAPLSEVGGPITIGRLAGQAARQGVPTLLELMAFLSVNLALVNLLPIPILDGGQLAFLAAEAVRRKPLPMELRLRLTQIGFAVLATLMLVVISREFLALFSR